MFQNVAWTLLFDKIVSGKRYSKLVRLIASLSNYVKASGQVKKLSDLDKTAKSNVKRRRGRPKLRRK